MRAKRIGAILSLGTLLSFSTGCLPPKNGDVDLLILALVVVPDLKLTFTGAESPGQQWEQTVNLSSNRFSAEDDSGNTSSRIYGNLSPLPEEYGYDPLQFTATMEGSESYEGTPPGVDSTANVLVAGNHFLSVSVFSQEPGDRVFSTIYVPADGDCQALDGAQYHGFVSAFDSTLSNFHYMDLQFDTGSSGEVTLVGDLLDIQSGSVLQSGATLGTGPCSSGVLDMADGGGGSFDMVFSKEGSLATIHPESNGGNFALEKETISIIDALESGIKRYTGYVTVFNPATPSTAEAVYDAEFSCDTVTCNMYALNGSGLPPASFSLSALNQGKLLTSLTFDALNYNMIGVLASDDLAFPERTGHEYLFTFVAMDSSGTYLVRGFFISRDP